MLINTHKTGDAGVWNPDRCVGLKRAGVGEPTVVRRDEFVWEREGEEKGGGRRGRERWRVRGRGREEEWERKGEEERWRGKGMGREGEKRGGGEGEERGGGERERKGEEERGRGMEGGIERDGGRDREERERE